MKDRVRRLLWPFQDWELEQQQAWLADMAKQGWHLRSTGPGLASFRKGEQANVRYRCEIAPDANQEQIELFQAAGWEYVGRRNCVLVFRAPVDEQIPEIHTDSREQAPTLRLLVRNLLVSLLPFLVLTVIVLGPGSSPDFVEQQLLEANWLDLLSLSFLLYVFVISLRGLFHTAGLIRKLKRGRSLENNVPYRTVLRRRQLVVPVMLLMAVALIASHIGARISDAQSTNFPPIPERELPMVRLSQLLDQAGYTEYHRSRTGTFLAERVKGDVFNYYRERGNLLFPVQQKMSEKFDVPGVAAPDQPTYSPILITRRFEARNPDLARLLAEQVASREKADIFRMTNLQPAELPGVDGFWRQDEGEAHAFVLLKGNVVVDVYYNGIDPIEQLIELQLAKLPFKQR